MITSSPTRPWPRASAPAASPTTCPAWNKPPTTTRWSPIST